MNTNLIIHGRSRDLGGFSVHRSLPSAQKRAVGPFVFLDHMGPLLVDDTHHLNVRPHPHIGLSTVTYLFEGRGHHRDSLGSNQVIVPGDLNWMTAGSGIVHSERTPEGEISPSAPKHIHGVQIWVGLPAADEECAPSFAHWPSAKLPDFKASAAMAGKVLIGKYQDYTSPVKASSRMLFMDLDVKADTRETLSFDEKEIALFVVKGTATINGEALLADDLIVVADPRNVDLQAAAGTRLVVIGGEPFPEPRYMWWNFVSSRKERIHQAADEWKNQKFAKVLGETEFIPLPNDPLP